MHNSADICPAYKPQITNNCEFFFANSAEHENFSVNKYENANYCWHFHISREFFMLSWVEHENFYNLGAWSYYQKQV